MSLENILQALEAENELRAREIEQATQVQIERICAEAEAAAAARRQQHLVDIQVPLHAEHARIINRAKREALRLAIDARETAIATALAAAADRLTALTVTEQYAGLLRRLVEEAIDRLGQDKKLTFYACSRDMALLQQIVDKAGLDVVVKGGLENEELAVRLAATSPWGALGGLVAVTNPDERVSLVNTLGARLQRVAGLYRSQIAAMILGQQQEG